MAIAACSFSAPGGGDPIMTGDGAPAIDGPPSVTDVALPIDAPPGVCVVDGTRVCVDATHSGHCVSGGEVIDRDCPPSSTCAQGFCAPPVGAAGCVGDVQCSGGQVCDVYVVGGVLVGFCTDPIGANSGSCSVAGNDPSCDSGICASGDSTRCLSPCTSGNDCVGSSQICVSISNPTTIEGQSTSNTRHCVPD